MPRFHACELHLVSAGRGSVPAHDKFYRLVALGTAVQLRWGRRGTQGQHSTHTVATDSDALDFYSLRRSSKRAKGYTAVYDSFAEHVPAGTDAEALFLAHWAADGRAALAPPAAVSGTADASAQWIVFQGLLGERGKDAGATAMLDYLEAGAHASDPTTDRIVGLVHQPPGPGAGGLHLRRSWGQDYDGYQWAASLLGLAGGSANPDRVAELLLFLLGGKIPAGLEWADRRRLVDSARRLASVAGSPVRAAGS